MNNDYKSIYITDNGEEYEITAIKGHDIYKEILPEAVRFVQLTNNNTATRLYIGKVEMYLFPRMSFSEAVAMYEKEYLMETGMMMD